LRALVEFATAAVDNSTDADPAGWWTRKYNRGAAACPPHLHLVSDTSAMAVRHTARGYWLDEARPVEPAPALAGDERADVVIVGGGYTGLWTAWHLKQLEPEARVVLLEAQISGDGPSGRNGGFCNGLWFGLPAMRERFGDEGARAIAFAAQDAVDRIGRFCEQQGVDAWFTPAGYMQVSTAPAWDQAWQAVVAACRAIGRSEACLPLTPEEVRARCGSPIFRAGALYPGGATVQPARLARGLRNCVRAVGVELFERTPVEGVRRRGGAIVAEAGGDTVTAEAAVMATGGALAGHARLRRRLTVTSSHIVITEPVPDYLQEIGWSGGECITDSRAMIHYFRTTPDGRIAFGWGGGPVARGARTDGRAEMDPVVVADIERHLVRFFPGLEGRRIEHAWGGPIDASPSHLPVVEELEPGIHGAFGYTGHGVGPSHMVGRSLASLALGRADEPARLAYISPEPVRVPPEPFRFIGGSIIRRAILRKEEALERSERPGPFTRLVAGIPERIGIHIGR
jgi:glycine/D-amino acid oxidase-like deaminating enzyme